MCPTLIFFSGGFLERFLRSLSKLRNDVTLTLGDGKNDELTENKKSERFFFRATWKGL